MMKVLSQIVTGVLVGVVVLLSNPLSASETLLPTSIAITFPVSSFDQQPSRLSPESSAHAILLSAFQESGWSLEHAVVHANNAMAQLGIAGYAISPTPAAPEGKGTPGQSLLSPSTDVHATILEAFIASGWSTAEAIAHTEHVLVNAGLPASDDPGNCQVRRIVIQYCEGGHTKYFLGYLAIQCNWQLFPNPMPGPCVLPQCLGSNVPWHTMTTTSGCDLGYAGCVRVWFRDTMTVPCTEKILECDCFEEDTCEDVAEVECCPPLTLTGSGGCGDCPCDP